MNRFRMSRPFVALVGSALASVMIAGCASGPAPLPKAVGQEAMSCGQLGIRLAAAEGDGLALTVGKETLQLVAAESASGALYVAESDDTTRFWSKGDRATLTIRGQAYPECLAAGALELPFRASGNEPGWLLNVEAGQLRYQAMGGSPVTLGYQTADAGPRGQRLVAALDGGEVTVITAPQLCHDTMTGMPYPHQVRVEVDGQNLQGCGGSPERLLRGTEWVVEDIAGGGIIDSSRVTVEFLADNSVAGRASCNRYRGEWSLSGEGLTFSRLISTRMACPPALMDQERRFLEVLAGVRQFDIGQHGELLLRAGDGQTLKAFRASGN